VGDILDRSVKAGATDIGDVVFLVSDQDKALDQAREAAGANARHKAELYARASGVTLGPVAWITETSSYVPAQGIVRGNFEPRSKTVPIERGEETLRATINVGFDIAQ
jgi:uncharacterized protein